MKSLSRQKVAIISHVYAPGPPHELEAYLKDRVKELFFIAHPVAFVKNRPSSYRRYHQGQLIADLAGRVWPLPDLLVYVKDVLANLWLMSQGSPYDTVIALDNLNATTAIWLRAWGRVKSVVFYTIDYIPKRFNNPILNWIYHRLDDYCVRRADFVWNLSPVMTEMRQKKGIEPKYRAKQLIVPIGTHLLNEKRIKKDPNLVVFMGHLRPGQGVELLIEAMPLVLAQRPGTRLRLIGGGPLEAAVKKQIKQEGLSKAVELTGFVPSNQAMRQSLLEGSVAVAPYVDDATTFTRYTDPGKPKEYLAAGLPVIITKVPQFALTIAKKQAGKAIDYDKHQLAEAIVELLNSPDLPNYQSRARRLAADYGWEKIFDQAFTAMAS